MGVTGHVPQPAPEARALSRQEQAARYAPYQALIERVEELDAYSHQVMHQWPKVERHVLAAEVRATLLRIRRICAVAWKRRQKAAALFDLDVEIEVLRHLVRKAHARQTLERIADACASLKLRLNPKSRYEPWQRGLDFCGYRIWPTHILPRKRNTKRWRQRLRRLAADYASGRATLDDARQMIASCIAYHRHASAHRTLACLLSDTLWQRSSNLC